RDAAADRAGGTGPRGVPAGDQPAPLPPAAARDRGAEGRAECRALRAGHRSRNVGGAVTSHRGGGLMPSFDLNRTGSGWRLDAGGYLVEADSPRLDGGVVRVALTVRRDGVVLYRDTANLTSGRTRARVLGTLAERAIT